MAKIQRTVDGVVQSFYHLNQTMTTQFIGKGNFTIHTQTVSESCPSNIALIKYWGNMTIRFRLTQVSVIL